MSKFTIFTVLMTIVTVVAVSDVLVNDYSSENGEVLTGFNLPEDVNELTENVQTSVLGGFVEEENSNELLPEEQPVGEVEGVSLEESDKQVVNETDSTSNDLDFEAIEYVDPQELNAYIREDHLRPSGYLDANLLDEDFEGDIFKTISLADIVDADIEQALIRTDDEYLTRVYVIQAGLGSDIQNIYELIKSRAVSTSTSINETNEFGNSSFYMNDLSRSSTAFLTVRIGRLIYSFSYPKQYHPQVKNLITLLEWEFGGN